MKKNNSSEFGLPAPNTESGRGLPITNTPTPKPPTKPPAQKPPKSEPKK